MSLEATLATWELTKHEVNSREKFLLLSLARRAGEEHTCWPSIKRIVEDTGFDRKTVIDLRQTLIDKKLLNYTGRMVGRSGQIPEMRLLYVDQWEETRNSPGARDEKKPVDNFADRNGTGTGFGTGTSPKNDTGTSTENGTLNSKGEKVSRKKSFCAVAPEKPRSQSKSNWKTENAKVHAFAESKNQMAREAKHIEQHEAIKRAPIPEEFKDLVKKLKRRAGVGCYGNAKDGGRLQESVV